MLDAEDIMNKLHNHKACALAEKTIKQALRMSCGEYCYGRNKGATEAHRRAT